ncbi:hypothetical protein [Rubrobacter marinus]|uniref:hypothetical protein n=1 Tax=Rubrobacter marinus TaxID=2653852 RepID=UPI001407B41E|nr:hypothetical protein [Rubrobacter marinus]
MRVIVAIEPRSYRQVIGEAIGASRPDVEVTVLEPATLGAAVARLDPDLVFSNRPDTFAPDRGTAWIEFLPYEHPPARIRIAGRRRELEEVELEDLLSIVDEAAALARAGREPGNR